MNERLASKKQVTKTVKQTVTKQKRKDISTEIEQPFIGGHPKKQTKENSQSIPLPTTKPSHQNQQPKIVKIAAIVVIIARLTSPV